MLLFICFAVFPVVAQQPESPNPPAWIHGTWTYTEPAFDGGGGEQLQMSFVPNDILFDDGTSLNHLISIGEVEIFTQKLNATSYEIYIKYADSYWFREIFQRPAAGAKTMRSTYETSEGESNECIYTRK